MGVVDLHDLRAGQGAGVEEYVGNGRLGQAPQNTHIGRAGGGLACRNVLKLNVLPKGRGAVDRRPRIGGGAGGHVGVVAVHEDGIHHDVGHGDVGVGDVGGYAALGVVGL